MNIKSLLIGSAAALAAVSGAQAADAIVAAEPEPMEYVRVCDAFGTGFFYIPGTETCLKIGGFVRFQTSFGRDEIGTLFQGKDNDRSDWDAHTRVDINFDARSDTELGTLRGFINIEANSGSHGISATNAAGVVRASSSMKPSSNSAASRSVVSTAVGIAASTAKPTRSATSPTSTPSLTPTMAAPGVQASRSTNSRARHMMQPTHRSARTTTSALPVRLASRSVA